MCYDPGFGLFGLPLGGVVDPSLLLAASRVAANRLEASLAASSCPASHRFVFDSGKTALRPVLGI